MIRLTLLTSLSLSLVSAAFDYISEAHSFMDPEDVLSVDIPLEEPQRPLLGSSLVLPCFFQDHTVPDPGAPVIPPLSHRIKWSFVTKKNVSTVLVALGGQVRIGKGYLDRVQLLNYPQTPEDASIRISELRSSDTGVYSCEVQLGIEDDHDFVQVYVTGVVFHYRSFMGRYALTFEEAKTTCSQNSAAIASPEQLQAAYDDGFHQCDAGWISDQTVRYPIHDVRVNCFGDKEDLPGVRNYGVRDPREKYDVYCFAEKMTGRVFFTTSVEKFTVSEAALACSRHGAQLATTGQLYIAWQGGMDVCNTGWLADLSVRYPINVRRPQCGGGLLGVRTVYLHPNQTGFPLPESRHGAFCYADSPDDKSLNSGSGSGDESGPWRVSTVTKDPQLLFSWVTSESEVVGEMETQASSALNVTNFENPKMLVSPTVIITEAMEAINRPGVGKEPNTGSTMPPAGVVFHYRSHTGRYTFNFSEAQLACQSVGGSIASPQQLQAAYESGYHQCDAGWLLDQTVRYSIVVPRDKCAGDLGDQPGVRSYGMRPADERYDVYCYIEDLRGEVFHLESADGLTYDQAVLSCQEHGGILASTGELYAAWKTGFDKCRAGWLQDGSVRYPINIPRARCGGGKHGVHTVYAHPNQTGFPPREDRYDAYCIRMNILLTANETGPNATDNHNKQLNHTSVADSFRLSLSSIVPSVYVEMSGSGSGAENTAPEFAGGCIFMNHCGELSGSDFGDQIISGDYTSSTDPPGGVVTNSSGSGLSGSRITDTSGSSLSESDNMDGSGAGLSGSSNINGSRSGFNGTNHVDSLGSGLSGSTSMDGLESGLSGSNSTDDTGSGLGGSNSTDYTGSGLSGSNSTDDTGSGLSGSNITNNSGSRLSGSDRTDDPGSGLSGSTRTDDPGSGLRGSNITDNSGSGLSGSDRTDDPGSGLSGSTRTDDPGSGLSGSKITENSGSSHSGFSSIDGSGSGFIGPSGVDNSGSGLSGLSSVDSSGLGLSGSNSTDDKGSGLSGSNSTDYTGSGLSGSNSTNDTGSGLSGSNITNNSGSRLSGSDRTDDPGSGLSGSTRTDDPGSGLRGSNITDNSGSGLSGSDRTDDPGSGLSGSTRTDDPGSGLSGSNITENSGSSHSGFSSIDGSGSGFIGPSGVDNSGSGLSGLSSVDSSGLGLSGSNSTDDKGSGLSGSNSTDYTGSGLSGSNSTNDTGSGLSGSNSTDDTGSGVSGSNSTDNTGSGLSGSNITDNSGSGLSGSDRTDDPGSGLSGSTRTDYAGSGLSGSNITENSGSSHSGFSSIDGSGSGFSGPSGMDNSGSVLSGLSSVDSSGLGLSGSNSTDDKGSGLSGLSSVDSSGLGLSGSNSTYDKGSGLSGSNSTDDTGSGLRGSNSTDDPGSGVSGSYRTENSGSGLSGSDRTDNSGSGLSGSDRTDDPGSGLSESNITENSGSGHSGFSSIDGSGSGFSGPSGVDNSGSGLSGLSSVDSSGLGLGGSSTIIAIGSALSGYSNFDDSGSGLSGSSSTDGLESGLSGSSSADGSGSTLNGGGYNIPVVLSKLESFALEGGSALSREVKEGRPAILFFPSSVEGSGEPSGSRNLSWSGPKTGLASVDSGFSVESSGGSKALSGTTSGFILHQDFSGFKGFTSGSLSGSGSGQTREFEGSGNPQIFLIHDKLMDASVNQKQHELGGGPPVLSGSGDFSGSGILGGSFSDSDPESVSVLSSDVTSIGSGIPEVSVSSAAEHKQASEILLHSSGQGGEIQLSGLRGSTFVSQSVSGFSRSDIPSNEDKVKNLFLREDPNRQRKSRERGSEDHSGDGSQSGNGDAIATTAFFLGETSGHKQAEATTKPEKVTEVPVDGSEHVPAGLEARLITAEPAFEETSRITEDLDVCHPNPCANGATCVESADSFRCLCLPSYGGERCDVDEQHCAEGWTKFQGNCYLHVSKRETWPGAEQHCRSLNAHLVSIITPEEQQFVNANAKAYQWIGLNDRTVENDFHWTDCTPVQYQNWKQNQPDNYGSGENCVVMIWLKNGLWNDEPCHYHLPFTCKKGPVSCGEPPHVVNAVMFGRKRLEYPVRSIVRYQCNPGFRQRHSPVIRCQADGLWETPRVECVDAKARTRAGAGIIRRLPSATQGTARSS
ncbi:uncharacterized protein LOC101165132 isoform X2 [Oryzias latipes]|uniref:Aggrecan core protein n=1 Tax=Oryzias latipes TaxID=8090 RepID=H2L317_ORYLA